MLYAFLKTYFNSSFSYDDDNLYIPAISWSGIIIQLILNVEMHWYIIKIAYH